MTLNAGNLELVLAQKINCCAATMTSEELMGLAKAVQRTRTQIVFCAVTFSALPSAASNEGKIYWVSDISELLWAHPTCGWIPMFPNTVDTIWSWGSNSNGILGSGTTTNRSSPGSVLMTSGTWARVSTAQNHSAAVSWSQQLWTWGRNTNGQLGNNSVLARSSPITVSGSVTTWCGVSTGGFHTMGITAGTCIYMWGYNNCGQIGDNTTSNRSSPTVHVGSNTAWCAISAGCISSSAIKSDGTLWTWGSNGCGILGDNTTNAKSSPATFAGTGNFWCSVSMGCNHAAAVTTSGVLFAWGWNHCGQLGDTTTADRSSPVSVVGAFTNWCATSVGSCHTSGVRSTGSVWSWGGNSTGQLGNNSTAPVSSPVSVVGGFANWCIVTNGASHSAGLTASGNLWTWGCNNNGQLGNNSVLNASSPVSTSGGLTSWFAVSAGSAQTLAIQARAC